MFRVLCLPSLGIEAWCYKCPVVQAGGGDGGGGRRARKLPAARQAVQAAGEAARQAAATAGKLLDLEVACVSYRLRHVNINNSFIYIERWYIKKNLYEYMFYHIVV